MNILISHLAGNANTRAAVYGLKRAGLLGRYITSVAVFNDWKGGLLKKLPVLKKFARKCYQDCVRSQTICYPWRELGRQFSGMMHLQQLVSTENAYFSVFQGCRYIDHKAARYLTGHAVQLDAVYCYEDIALETFRTAKLLGKKCIYDLPIGHWREMRKLLGEERSNQPDWAVTLGGFKDSDAKLAQKDEELALADKIYVASTFTKNSLRCFPRPLADIEVIPYGFPEVNKARIYHPFKGRKIKALFVGGLSQRKGIAYVFEAVRGLEDKVELTVVGSGNLEGCCALKKALSHVTYIPSMPHEQVLQLMSEHDVFLFPSLFEGFGLVITESMSQGTPVITTDRTCGPDLLTNGQDGWIVEAGTARPIRELLESFIKNPEQLTTVGRAAQATAAQRPWRKYEEELSQSVAQFLAKE